MHDLAYFNIYNFNLFYFCDFIIYFTKLHNKCKGSTFTVAFLKMDSECRNM